MFEIPAKTVVKNGFKILFLAAIILAVLSPGSFWGTDGIIAGITGTTTVKAANPVVTTEPATGEAATTATLNGSLTGTEGDSVAVLFEWGTTTSYGNQEPGVPSVRTSDGTFYADLTDLTPGTTYHFRAVAISGTDPQYNGADVTFTTSTSAPAVTTNPAGNITTTGATLNGNLTSTGGAGSVTVSFEWGTTTSYGNTAAGVPSPLSEAGTFTAALTSLTPGQTYHFRARAVGDGTALGGDQSFTAASTSPPVVSTDPAGNITTTGATLNGDLTDTGTAGSVTVSFEWGETDSYGETAAGVPSTRTSAGTFTAALTGLTPDQTYHFRAVADGDGTDVGNDRTFTTSSASSPNVTTEGASDITTTGATLNGNLTDLGTAESVDVYFEWGEDDDYGNTTTSQEMSETGIFTAELTGLTPGQTYHFRAIADGDGTDVGSDLSFTASASSAPPAVTTMSASNITSTGAILNGNLTDLGSDDYVTVSFEWGETDAYGKTVSGVPSNRSSIGTFTYELTGLSPGTTYHFRAKAIGDENAYGADRSFTTPTSPPVVVTAETVDNLTSKGATLKGNLTDTGGAETVTVAFEYGTTKDYGSTATPPLMDSPGTFTANLTGLIPGTTYHFRAKATGNGTSYGKDFTFTTPQLPEDIRVVAFEIDPQTAQVGKEVKISITCENIGGSPSVYSVIFKINGDVEYTEEVSLDPGDIREIAYKVTENEVGTYEVDVNGLTSSFVVRESLESSDDIDWLLIGGIAGGTLIAGLVVLFIFRRNIY